MEAESEREKIAREIRELERVLELSESSLGSDSDAGSLPSEDCDDPGPPNMEEDRWAEGSSSELEEEKEEEEEEEDPRDRKLPEDPETCLQLNMVYQEVVQEKLAEVNLLLAQNRTQQEEITWDLAGSRGPKARDRKNLPPHLYIGHFMKPYFKDKVTGVGPPANEDMREKAAQGVKSFEQLLVTKWKGWEKALLRKAVMSDRLQRLLQPKLLKLEYLQQKQSRVSSEHEKQLLEKQVRDAEKEIQDIHQLPEETLLGARTDNHDWEKIANVNFEGDRSAEEIQKLWQNCEHPSINQQAWSREEVERLKALSAQHGHLQWQRIAEELGTRRSAFQCLQKYQQHNSDLKRHEWTAEEDSMLTQLVQEMRVGNHIPYRKIVYYMEGRDSMQLIYRWTKSLDPRLRKGCWTPEEDAKLLQAVARHGGQDWFKIRKEVPGRSDAQCRDRYFRRLHASLKKGRWNSEEEEKLVELIEKHGAGHWAKIAAELPHRTGSQCLSKWKAMLGKKQGSPRGQRRPRRCVRWSSSSSDSTESGGSGSSSDSSNQDTDPELDERLGPGGDSQLVPYVVPSMDLWVPVRQSGLELGKWGSWSWPGLPPVPAGTSKEAKAAPQSGEKAPATGAHSDIPDSTDTCPGRAREPEDESGAGRRKVPLETVLRVLRGGMAARGRELKEQLRRPLPSPVTGPRLECPAGQRPGPSQTCLQAQRRHRQKHKLQGRLLTRRLLMAVGPWVGPVLLPRTPSPQRPPTPTRADRVQEQLRGTGLTSTPVFALLIQLFQIDAEGCLKVIRERKRPPPAPTAPCGRLARSSPDGLSPTQPAQAQARQGASHKDRGPPAPAGPRPKPKPKTVSELLREKRLQEARARRASQASRPLSMQLLVSAPRTPLPLLRLTPHGPLAPVPVVCPQPPPRLGVHNGVSLGTAGPLQGAGTSASTGGTWPALAPGPTRPRSVAHKASKSHVPVLGQSPVHSATQKQGLPELPALLPAVPSPTLTLVGTRAALPGPWVLTTPGLLPVAVPAVMGFPRPTGTPAPGLSLAPLPSAKPPALPPAPHCPAEASKDPASAPRAPPHPRKTAPPPPPETPSQALLPPGSPQAEVPPPSEAGSGSGPAGTPGTSLEVGPVAPEQPRSTPPLPSPKKEGLATSLLSLEDPEATQAWLRGGPQGVCAPPLQSGLPYQPPALCTLRTLAGLLLHKDALEREAAALVPHSTSPAAALEVVRGALGDSPAYLLLKARFLAAFSLPAFLATLPPRGVPTTLSAASGLASDGASKNLGDPTPPADGTGPQPGPRPRLHVQASAPYCADNPDDLFSLKSRHSRKRRRLS